MNAVSSERARRRAAASSVAPIAAAIGAPCVLASHPPNRAPPTGVILNRVLRAWSSVRAAGFVISDARAGNPRALKAASQTMPKRTDIESICIVGSGPIVIGQAAEFDYAGCQALKVLREDGYRTIVVNSNPAPIMTDPGFPHRTYLEPLDLAGVADVLRRERPDALLPTMGGQTALNLARELAEAGVPAAPGGELIGPPPALLPPPQARPRLTGSA